MTDLLQTGDRQVPEGASVGLCDSHAHFPVDASLAEQWIARARERGLDRIVAVGGSPQLNRTAQAAARAHAGMVWPAIGLDRGVATSGDEASAQRQFEDLLQETAPVAIGEIGIDYHYHGDDRKVQCALMERQLEVADERRLPVIVHTREADDDTLMLLRNAAAADWFKSGGRPGVIHCFTGGMDFAVSLLELGYGISFSGIVTFANAASLREVAARIPGDRLLVETDAPFLAPVPLRGRANEPAYLPHVVDCLAKVRKNTTAAIAAVTRRNAARLFAFD